METKTGVCPIVVGSRVQHKVVGWVGIVDAIRGEKVSVWVVNQWIRCHIANLVRIPADES